MSGPSGAAGTVPAMPISDPEPDDPADDERKVVWLWEDRDTSIPEELWYYH